MIAAASITGMTVSTRKGGAGCSEEGRSQQPASAHTLATPAPIYFLALASFFCSFCWGAGAGAAGAAGLGAWTSTAPPCKAHADNVATLVSTLQIK